ncbi:MAG: hypothetical protein LBM73_02815 [Candidatus Nomurabacteria bacterium]|nr:hypothetical protein [Candidatus Nomurabacteria bacterium]
MKNRQIAGWLRQHNRRRYWPANLALVGAALAIMIGLSIGWSTLQTRLNISGTAQIKAKPKTLHISKVTTNYAASGSACGHDTVSPAWTDDTYTITGHWTNQQFCVLDVEIFLQNDTAFGATFSAVNDLVETNPMTSSSLGSGSGALQIGDKLAAGASGQIVMFYVFYGGTGSGQDFISQKQLVWSAP